MGMKRHLGLGFRCLGFGFRVLGLRRCVGREEVGCKCQLSAAINCYWWRWHG